MAKNNINEKAETKDQVVEETAIVQKQETKNKPAKKVDPNKKPNIFVRFWRKIKEIFSELRKVTWPTFGKTMKQTGVVIGVTLFFFVALGAINTLFFYLYTLMTDIPFTSLFS